MNLIKAVIIGLTFICFTAITTLAWGEEVVEPDEGSCQTILTTKCNSCHHLARVCQKIGQKNKRSWKRSIKRMVKNGARLKGDNQILFTKEEEKTLLDCLVNKDEGATVACK